MRNALTCSSRSAAIRETCDFDNDVMPRVVTSLSIRRVETPSRWQVATTEISAASARCGVQEPVGEVGAVSDTFGIVTSIVPARVSRSRWR